jgi:hypothetical protein
MRFHFPAMISRFALGCFVLFLFAGFLFASCLFANQAPGKDAPRPLLVSHSDFKALEQSDSRIEDLYIFSDGRVRYVEAPNYGKKASFAMTLSPQKLERLTLLLHGAAMRAVPPKIGSQIKVLDGQTDKTFEINHGASQQRIVIENFYPQLNSHRPAYPKVLVELECTLQEIQRRAAKRPAPAPEENWCPEALGKR